MLGVEGGRVELTALQYFWLCYNTLQASPSEEFPKLPPYFRFLTLMGFKVFQEERIEAGVVEVGIGGRTDATNVLLPHCCGVSSIGLDHQTVLGDTLGQIAWEKSGIFKVCPPHRRRVRERESFGEEQG